MKNIHILIVACILNIAFAQCSFSQKEMGWNIGYAASTPGYWDFASQQFLKPKNIPDWNFWFKDSMIIYENYVLDTETDLAGKTTYQFSVLDYTFFDLKTKQGYDYLHFSDTAKCIKKGL